MICIYILLDPRFLPPPSLPPPSVLLHADTELFIKKEDKDVDLQTIRC